MKGVYFDQFPEPISVVVGADLFAEDAIQHQWDGVGHGEGQQHEELGDPHRVGSDGQTVTRTDGLYKSVFS